MAYRLADPMAMVVESIDAAIAADRRAISAWSCDEVIVPRGPREGLPFDLTTQPFVRLFFAELESAKWLRSFVVGPSQSGKTLSAFVIPLIYWLMEQGEDVLVGIPDANMASDKWSRDILPVLERTRYRDLLPTTGEGSRGGNVETEVKFRNGRSLRFLTAGGGDKTRAGYSARVLIVTETDAFDVVGAVSREASKFEQLEARTQSHGSRSVLIAECTASTSDGRTWVEYEQGTRSRIVRPCPHCGEWVTPEREHLVGWQTAKDVIEARESAAFVCPSCGATWTEAQRIAACQRSVLVHHGQTVDKDGQVVGDGPRTDTLGFRWTAADNLLVTAGDIAVAEWRASRSSDASIADTKMRQFWWAMPATSSDDDDAGGITPVKVVERAVATPRGKAPGMVEVVSIGCDIGRHLAHWCMVGTGGDASGHVMDYGRIEVPTRELGEERAVSAALAELADIAERVVDGGDRQPHGADVVIVDSGYMTGDVYRACLGAPYPMMPAKGYGVGQRTTASYIRPRRTGSVVRRLGDGWHVALLTKPTRVELLEFDANQWKRFVHQRFLTPTTMPGAWTLFEGGEIDHLGFAQHVCSEVEKEEFKPRTGVVKTMVPRRGRNNHWLDALSMASVGLSMLGVQVGGGQEIVTPTIGVASGAKTLADIMGGKR